jgi:16S rRNA (guanine1516-N2)-methyltransferase
MLTSQSKIAVSYQEPNQKQAAEKLTAALKLPMAETDKKYQLLLNYTASGLELRKPNDPRLTGSVQVNFTAGKEAFRRQQQKQQKQELLIRAVGCRPDQPPTVLDGTGGLGRDSFILATAGCRVLVHEQHPVVAALLADGLQRAAAHPATAAIASRISLTRTDTVHTLLQMEKNGQQVDVIYLDPMFPTRRKSALVKKELQMLQILTEKTADQDQLLPAALRVAACRVVVKRPCRAHSLNDLSPSHALTGKTVRFDVYVC